MNRKNDAQVLINGKTYNIAGYENVDYLLRIAEYLNRKYAEIRSQTGRNIINDSEQNILMLINIADDYLKLRAKEEEIYDDSDDKSKEITSLRRELVAAQTKLEANLADEKALRNENLQLQKKIVKLETELNKIKD